MHRNLRSLRPSVMVPLCDSFSSRHLFGHPKVKAVLQQCLWPKKHSIQKIVRIVLVYSSRYTSYVQIFRIVLAYSARAYLSVYICGTIKCGNKMMAYCPRYHLRGQILARHPFLLDFHILGTYSGATLVSTRGVHAHIFFGTMLLR